MISYTYIVISCLAWKTVAQYVVVPFNKSRPVGPDGPWYPITLWTGAPVQYVDYYPTMNASTNWFVASLNCNNASQSCLDTPDRYYDSTSWSGLRFNEEIQNNSLVSLEDIYGSRAQLLGANTSFGHWHVESFTLASHDTHPDAPHFAGTLSQITSNYTNIEFPNGRSYVPLSLFTLDPSELYIPLPSNHTDNYTSLITDLVIDNSITSASWSMHMGSYFQKIAGTLIFGGYDPSRLAGEPAAYSSSRLELSSISLSASEGGYSWSNNQVDQNYLDSQAVNVSITPSLPYLYLPSNVCSKMAEDLPVTFNPDFNLYMWNVNDPSFTAIVTSPSYLNFTFTGQNSRSKATINVPFALLNLTLQNPLVENLTSYFPCFPSNTFALGRAFLQSAFIAQNYNSSTFWLGQASGPKGIDNDAIIKIIRPIDAALIPNPTTMTWEQSWADALKPISSPTISAASMQGNAGPSLQLSNGAIAGIVIGVVAFVVLAIVATTALLKRRKNVPAPGPKAPEKHILNDKAGQGAKKNEVEYKNLVEAQSEGPHAHEMQALRDPIEVPSHAPLAEM